MRVSAKHCIGLDTPGNSWAFDRLARFATHAYGCPDPPAAP